MIQPSEYARRRKQLMRMAGGDAIVIVAAAPERVRNNDAHYPYRQDSDFHYLTGFPEAEAVLALSREVVERVVWEVVPQLAETIIKEELARLTRE